MAHEIKIKWLMPLLLSGTCGAAVDPECLKHLVFEAIDDERGV
jgi:hypothetical protein